MNYAAGFISGAVFGFWAGIASTVILFAASWAAWFYRDKLLWGRVREAEKATPPHCDLIWVNRHFGTRL